MKVRAIILAILLILPSLASASGDVGEVSGYYDGDDVEKVTFGT